jgi:alginate O-acetyltransferase complex protein AlgJ
VLDLLPIFWKHRFDEAGEVYCKTDSHWSGRGIELAARAIKERNGDADIFSRVQHTHFAAESREIEISGDLARMIDETHPAKEKVRVTFVGQKSEGELIPPSPDRNSPLLLIGDSHTLVFHDPELFTRGAGLPDHLAREFGIAVDLIGMRGSGGTSTRIELLRRKDNLAKKRLVVWCFSFREFSESTTGWRKVPVIK